MLTNPNGFLIPSVLANRFQDYLLRHFPFDEVGADQPVVPGFTLLPFLKLQMTFAFLVTTMRQKLPRVVSQ